MRRTRGGRRTHLARLKDYFIPHRGNFYKPAFFDAASIAAVLLLLVLLEGAYLTTTRLAFFKTDFMASVLPGALVSLANTDREAAGVADLTPDPLLAQAAQLKADDMAAKGYFSHVTPDGKQPWYWFDQVSYPYTYAGENLAVNFTDSKDVEEAWMASPTHHANLVKAQYTQVGIGIAQGQYEGKDATFVVQFFAAKKAASAAAPAVAKAAAKPAVSAASSSAIAVKTVATTSTLKTAPQAEPAPLLAVASSATSTAVLGTEITPAASFAGFLSAIATSPAHDLIFILTALIVLVAVLLIVSVVVKARVQYREVIGGGLVLLLVLLALLIYTKGTVRPVQLPGDMQSASVLQAFAR